MFQIVKNDGKIVESYRIFNEEEEVIEIVNQLNALLNAIGFLSEFSYKRLA